jgi:hypothetical protein
VKLKTAIKGILLPNALSIDHLLNNLIVRIVSTGTIYEVQKEEHIKFFEYQVYVEIWELQLVDKKLSVGRERLYWYANMAG